MQGHNKILLKTATFVHVLLIKQLHLLCEIQFQFVRILDIYGRKEGEIQWCERGRTRVIERNLKKNWSWRSAGQSVSKVPDATNSHLSSGGGQKVFRDSQFEPGSL